MLSLLEQISEGRCDKEEQNPLRMIIISGLNQMSPNRKAAKIKSLAKLLEEWRPPSHMDEIELYVHLLLCPVLSQIAEDRLTGAVPNQGGNTYKAMFLGAQQIYKAMLLGAQQIMNN